MLFRSQEDHQRLIYGWNDTQRPYPVDRTLQGMFEEQVERTPEKIAVMSGEVRLTYGELNGRANRLAHYLRDRYEIVPDELIGLCLDRNEHMLIGILGVLKAGGAYVPMDPGYPAERMEYMLSDTATKVVLTNGAHTARLSQIAAGTTVALEAIDSVGFRETLSGYGVANPRTGTRPDHLAYVIYRSEGVV